MFDPWPEARYRMDEILHFWFPFENLAAVFTNGLSQYRGNRFSSA